MPLFDGTPFVAKVTATSANTATDIFVPIPCGQKNVIFRRVTNTNASASLSGKTTEMGLYTAISKGGTAIVTGATGTLTSLTAATKFTDCTVATSADSVALAIPSGTNVNTGMPYNTTGVFLSIAGTPNSTATFDTFIEGQFV